MSIAAAIAGTGALSAVTSLVGSGKASSAAKDAANLQMQMYQQTQGNLAPFRAAGASVLPQLTSTAETVLPPMTEDELVKTPGYQFALSQGLKATQGAAAARGLGVSGASMKGAAKFATGIADNTYLNQFNMQQQNLMNQYQRLAGVASLGSGAAAGTSQIGATLAGNAGNLLNQSGLAQAAGTTGVGNAVSGAVGNYIGYNLLQQAIGQQNGTTGGYAPASTTQTRP